MKKDIPSLQSISDEDEDSDNHSNHMSDGELTENPDDDTIVYMSEMDTDIDGQPYHPIGDVLGETVAMILEALDHYPGDSLFLQMNQTQFSISHIDHEFIHIEDQQQHTIVNLSLEQACRHDFAPAPCYAHHYTLHTRYSTWHWLDTTSHLVMGDVLEQEIAQNL